MYEIRRFYMNSAPNGLSYEKVETVDTLEEAQERCKDPEGSSRTATSDEAIARTDTYGPWFEGFEEV